MFSFNEKTCFVSGSTRGIGLEIARQFASLGCNLIVNGRDSSVTSDVAQTLANEFGVKTLAVSGDVSSEKDVEEMIAKVTAEFDGIDILVNNAGITRDNLLMRMKLEDWQKVIDINLNSTFLLCKKVVPLMVRNKKGKIINISSVIGEVGNAGQTNYAASKGGMISFTKSLAKEVGGKNIQVNAVAPGYIETEMTDSLSEVHKNKILELVPLKKMGKPSDIASCVCFLASSGADYITGEVLSVNGGMAM